ncbi:glutathione S-transferase family protein [Engelhardtia mirabilis]|uniref:Glutathionyl-hydroquinone reductase YqjG n=1 Tax=Engelhardtia mirabilis TaxID=2528011 RepID=A0A518BFF2_9BACT|nr:Glutathionyl-hydroquinone reductase YqjG [Planctomycetes bacterium Pla133]QDV00027.1 Glutathionyl-hydroquinone reductase YqjG [Planctomycetes bacterium Pla86]
MAATDSTSAQFPAESAADGSWKRQNSAFRHTVEAGGEFPPEAGRYHLWVSLACPWAHRTIIVRKLKGLEHALSLSVVDPIRDERGWRFTTGAGHGPDPIRDFKFLSEAYRATDPDFDARVTVPTLWDRESGQIVNNESAELIVMLDGAFAELAEEPGPQLYPEDLREAIDEVNDFVYDHINDGVYKCGFAASQGAYDRAYAHLFDGLDELERRLAGQRYLAGDRLTLADVRAFTTLVRFDAVYHGHFKCNRQRLADFEHLWAYARDLYQTPGFGDTVDFDHIKRHYYVTHGQLNPSGIVPQGPLLDWGAPHGREDLAPAGPFGE